MFQNFSGIARHLTNIGPENKCFCWQAVVIDNKQLEIKLITVKRVSYRYYHLVDNSVSDLTQNCIENYFDWFFT